MNRIAVLLWTVVAVCLLCIPTTLAFDKAVDCATGFAGATCNVCAPGLILRGGKCIVGCPIDQSTNKIEITSDLRNEMVHVNEQLTICWAISANATSNLPDAPLDISLVNAPQEASITFRFPLVEKVHQGCANDVFCYKFTVPFSNPLVLNEKYYVRIAANFTNPFAPRTPQNTSDPCPMQTCYDSSTAQYTGSGCTISTCRIKPHEPVIAISVHFVQFIALPPTLLEPYIIYPLTQPVAVLRRPTAIYIKLLVPDAVQTAIITASSKPDGSVCTAIQVLAGCSSLVVRRTDFQSFAEYGHELAISPLLSNTIYYIKVAYDRVPTTSSTTFLLSPWTSLLAVQTVGVGEEKRITASDICTTSTFTLCKSLNRRVCFNTTADVCGPCKKELGLLSAVLPDVGGNVKDCQIDCSAKPTSVCTALHRNPCASVPQTCGTCMAGYNSTTTGPSNLDKCVISNNNNNNNNNNNGATCGALFNQTADCQDCVDGFYWRFTDKCVRRSACMADQFTLGSDCGCQALYYKRDDGWCTPTDPFVTDTKIRVDLLVLQVLGMTDAEVCKALTHDLAAILRVQRKRIKVISTTSGDSLVQGSILTRLEFTKGYGPYALLMLQSVDSYIKSQRAVLDLGVYSKLLQNNPKITQAPIYPCSDATDPKWTTTVSECSDNWLEKLRKDLGLEMWQFILAAVAILLLCMFSSWWLICRKPPTHDLADIKQLSWEQKAELKRRQNEAHKAFAKANEKDRTGGFGQKIGVIKVVNAGTGAASSRAVSRSASVSAKPPSKMKTVEELEYERQMKDYEKAQKQYAIEKAAYDREQAGLPPVVVVDEDEDEADLESAPLVAVGPLSSKPLASTSASRKGKGGDRSARLSRIAQSNRIEPMDE